MSSLVYGVEPVKVVSGNQAYGAKKMIPVVDGPSQLSFQPFQCQSANNSQLIYQINVPSLDTGVERALIYELGFTAVFTASINGAGNTITTQMTGLGLSDSCADQIIATETCQIGQKSNSVQRSRCGVELNRVNTSSRLLNQFQSGSGGTYKDYATNFAPWINTARNPLAKQYNAPQNDYQPTPRTSDLWITAVTDTTITVAGRIFFTSAVSPFLQTGIELPALRNLNVIQLQLQLEGQLARLFSYNFVPASNMNWLASIAVNITDSQVWCKFITPSKASLLNFTDADNIYNYNEIQVFTNNAIPVPASVNNAGAVTPTTRQFNLQQISGSTIPDLILLFARPVQTSITVPGNPDTNQVLNYNGANAPRWWLTPTKVGAVNLQFQNTPVLNGASVRQLYEMSIANGLTGVSYEQFAGRDVTWDQSAGGADATSYVLGGAPMVINPSRDFQISENGLVNGARANWSLSGSVTFANQTYSAVTQAELVVVCIYGGFLRSDGQVSAETGLLTREEIAKVTMSSAVPINDDIGKIYRRDVGYQGAGIFSKVANFLGKHKDTIAHVAKSAYEHRDKLKSGLAHARKLIGRGEYEEDYEGGASLDTSDYAVSSKRATALSYMRR